MIYGKNYVLYRHSSYFVVCRLPIYSGLFSFIPTIILLLALIILIILRRKITLNGIKSLTLICLAFSLVAAYTVCSKTEPAQKLSGYNATVTGTVCDWPLYYDTYTAYEIKTESIEITDENPPEKIPQNLKIRVTDINNADLKIFDKVSVSVTFNEPGNYKTSSFGEGIYAGGYLQNINKHLGKNRPFYAVFCDLREYINKLIYDNINYSEATVISAVLIGDHSRLDDDFYFDSKATGVTHMLVVSGMHFGILFQLLSALLQRLRVPRKIEALILMFSVFALSAVCGFTPSILRAGLTFFVLALGKFFFLKTDSLNSLGIAATVITFISPFSAVNIAFQLSFLSTFGLIYVCPLLFGKLSVILSRFIKINGLTEIILLAFCQTISATIFTLPISVMSFGYVSLVSLPANLLTGHAMTYVMVFSLCAVVFLALPGIFSSVASIFIVITCYLVRYTKYVVDSLADWNFAIIPAKAVYIIPLFLVILGIISAVIGFGSIKRDNLKKILTNASAVILGLSVVLIGTFAAVPRNKSLQSVSVGKGNCLLLRLEDKVIAIGAGDGETDAGKIKNSLFAMGKTDIDYIVFPSLEKSFAGGGAALLRKFPNSRVVLPSSGDFYDKLIYVDNGKYTYFKNNCRLSQVDNEVLIYKDKGAIINLDDYSVIVYIGGEVSELLKECTSSEIVLVCAGAVLDNVNELNIEKLVISGNNEETEYFLENNPLSEITLGVKGQTVIID